MNTLKKPAVQKQKGGSVIPFADRKPRKPRSKQVAWTAPTTPDYLVPFKSACKVLSIGESTAYKWIKEGILMRPKRVGARKTGYMLSDLQAFLANSEQTTSA